MSIRKKLILALLFLSFLMITNLVIIFQIDKFSEEKKDFIINIKNKIILLEHFMHSVTDAETGQRGYLLTLNKEYLEPYRIGIIESLGHLKELQEASLNNPVQLKNINKIEKLMHSKFNELQQTIDLANEGNLQSALEIVKKNSGQTIMRQIRSILNSYKDSERSILNMRELDYLKQKSIMMNILLIQSILFILIIFLIWRFFKKSIVIPIHDLKNGLFSFFKYLNKESKSIDTIHCNSNDEIGEMIKQINQNIFNAKKILDEESENILKIKESEYNLKNLTTKLTLAAKSANIGVWEWNIVNNSLVWDDKMYDIYGVDKNKSVDFATWHDALDPSEVDSSEKLLLDALKDGVEYDTYFWINTPLNERRCIRAAGTVLHNELGEVIEFVGLNWDITLQKDYESELKNAKKEAEDANIAKSSFLSNMSHEIRTPLNGILVLTQLTLESQLTKEQRYYLDKVHISAKSLLHIINDILDYSKIQSGKLELIQEPFIVDSILNNISELFVFSAEKKGIELLFNIDENVPTRLIGDSLRLSQILINIIGNAVKFTDKGEILLSVKVINLDDDRCELFFSVKDTGIGIKFKDQKKLFKQFSQVDDSYKRRFEGTGLGLAVSQQLVELMGSKIAVESIYGQGSTFSFNAKFGIGSNEADVEIVKNIKKGERVLVVDDSENSRIILFNILTSFGMKVDLSKDGEDAVEIIKKLLKQDETYDFILIDWKMPKLSGVETAKLITKLYQENGISYEPKVLLVTAYSRNELISELKKENLYPMSIITKPVTESMVYDRLIRNIQNGPVDKEYPTYKKYDERIDSIKGASILLVEDNEINQDVAKAYLTKMKLNIQIANDGLKALEIIKKDDFDLVLMDLQMPVMDGIEATKEIKKLEDKKMIPIIAMTAAAMEKDKQNSKNAGMNAHITKPIDYEELKEVLLKYIEPNIADRSFKEVHKTSTSTLQDFPNKIKGINLNKLLNKLDNDTALVRKMLLDFAKKYGENETVLNEHNMQSVEFHRYLHTLKGVSGNLIIEEVYRLARIINESDDDKEKMDLIAPLQNELKDVSQNIIEALSKHRKNNAADVKFSKDEIKNILDEYIKKLEQNFMVSFEEVENLIGAVESYINEIQMQEIRENFDQLNYKVVSKLLQSVVENISKGEKDV